MGEEIDLASPNVVETLCPLPHRFHEVCLFEFFKNQTTERCPNCRRQIIRADYFENQPYPQHQPVDSIKKRLFRCCRILGHIGYTVGLIFAFWSPTSIAFPIVSLVSYLMMFFLSFLNCSRNKRMLFWDVSISFLLWSFTTNPLAFFQGPFIISIVGIFAFIMDWDYVLD